jgi:drug/metabolite transporter (DMT)-like permease
MSNARLLILTVLALIAFAGNSLLCRAAFARTQIDAASFTSIRLLSGAIVMGILVWLRSDGRMGRGNWISALALFAYAAGFSFAYRGLSTAAGALILFGAVQITMIGDGLRRGERLRLAELAGLLLALCGLVVLLLPGLSAPPLLSAALMLGAGIAWGIYSLRGKGAGDPLKVTAENFVRAAPMAVVLSGVLMGGASWDPEGVGYALLSGALTSGVGYAIWYSALPFLKSTTAATVQLSVPVIAAAGGVFFLHESLTLRLFAASIAILGGIAMVVFGGSRKPGNISATAED